MMGKHREDAPSEALAVFKELPSTSLGALGCPPTAVGSIALLWKGLARGHPAVGVD